MGNGALRVNAPKSEHNWRNGDLESSTGPEHLSYLSATGTALLGSDSELYRKIFTFCLTLNCS